MGRRIGKALRLALSGLGIAVLWLAPAGAGAGDDSGETIEEIIGVLREQGLIDEREEERLRLKHAAEQQKRTPDVGSALLEGWDFYGDLRLRYELFDYDTDSQGNEADNRYRFRYRGRIGFEKTVNDWLLAGMRFGSGTDDLRSTNQTLGDDEDFDRDEVWIDRAYLTIALPRYAGLESELVAGKIANPFVWKVGKDFLVWDGDVNPEGFALTGSLPLSESARLFGNLGWFVVDENSSAADPKFGALQLGGVFGIGEGCELGLRATGYEWRSLDGRFIQNTTLPSGAPVPWTAGEPIDSAVEWGNLPTAFDGKARIGEASAYFKVDRGGDWPALVYGTFVENFTADSGLVDSLHPMSPGLVPVDEENNAWGVGLELGSPSRIAKLGLGYFYVEANSVIATFTDSNLFDGFTNRRGFVVYGSRKVAKNAEFKLTMFRSDRIKNTGGPFGPFAYSLIDDDRFRLQSDFEVKF